MVEKFCLFLVDKMRKENPEIDDERAESSENVYNINSCILFGYIEVNTYYGVSFNAI